VNVVADGVEVVEDEDFEEAPEDEGLEDVEPNEEVVEVHVMDDFTGTGSVEGGGTLSTGGAVNVPVGPLGNSALGTAVVAATGP